MNVTIFKTLLSLHVVVECLLFSLPQIEFITRKHECIVKQLYVTTYWQLLQLGVQYSMRLKNNFIVCTADTTFVHLKGSKCTIHTNMTARLTTASVLQSHKMCVSLKSRDQGVKKVKTLRKMSSLTLKMWHIMSILGNSVTYLCFLAQLNMNDLTMVNQLLCPPSLMLEDVGQQRILSSVCHAFRSCLSERCNVHSYQETGHRYVQGCAKLQKQTCMAENFAIHCAIINFILSLPVIFQISEINF